MTGTAVEQRRTLDLSRAPDEQWNGEMVKMVANQLFRGRDVTRGELYYCLSVAEGIGLNPLIGEVYFIPAKSSDGKGPTLQPYIGRNGLVRKAAEKGYYYESETVHENDKFTMRRARSGETVVTHSYTQAERGEIVGAYAFLHRRDGSERPAFFYAKLDEYLPTFDVEWKMAKSPWGNQRSAMIEKCAMIGAGRKRLELGNVLMDGEVARYQEQGDVGPGPRVVPDAGELDFSQFTADRDLADQLRVGAVAAGWPAAKCEMVMSGRSDAALGVIVDQLAGEVEIRAAQADVSAAEPQSEGEQGGGEGPPDASGSEAEIAEAVVVPDEEHAESLRRRAALLEERMMAAPNASDEQRELSDELDAVQVELDALENPDQPPLEGLGS